MRAFTAMPPIRRTAALLGGAAAPFADALADVWSLYSLRKGVSSYSGSCVRVRRSSDSTEQDIGFNGNALDTEALLSFVGSGDGFIATWYDQVGGRNVTAATALQPKIVSGGEIETLRGNPALRFSGANYLTHNGTNSLTASSFVIVYRNDTDTTITGHTFFSTNSTDASDISRYNDGKGYPSYFSTLRRSVFPTMVSNGIDAIFESYHSGNDMRAYINSIDRGLDSTRAFAAGNRIRIGANTNGGFPITGLVGELVIFSSDQNASRVAINSSIDGGYWGFSVEPPAAFTEYWAPGEGLLTTGDVPVTAVNQTVTKWIGKRLGTVLTGTNVKAELEYGVFVPKTIAGYFTLPGGFSTSRQDLTIIYHNQRPGCFQTRGFFGLGSSGALEVVNDAVTTKVKSTDGTTPVTHAVIGRASPNTISLRSNASSRKIGINGTEVTAAALASGTLSGGRLGDIPAGSYASQDRIYGVAIGPCVSDADYSAAIEWCDSLAPIPSETEPEINLVVFGDSNTEGISSGGGVVSWLMDVADSTAARVIPIVGGSKYFSVARATANGQAGEASAENLAQVALEYRSSAQRNIVIIATTNDFNFAPNANDYISEAKAAGQAFQSQGWEVYTVKFPYRTAPWTTTDTSYNANVDLFNAANVSDPWMDGVIDITGVNGNLSSDGIHWNATGQAIVANAVTSALGI